MKVKMNVGGMPVEYDIHNELNFDPENVFEVIGKQAGLQAWWSSLVVLKEQELADAHVDFDQGVAKLDKAIRDQAAADSKKTTEAQIKSMIALDEGVAKKTKALNKLKRDAGFLKAMARAFDSRTTLLATSGSAQKAELQARLKSLVRKTSETS